MKAIGHRRSGEPDVLEWIEVPDPDPGPHDLLVRVEAVSVNPADLKLRAGTEPTDGARILGFDAAGTVVGTGGRVTRFAPGDEVFYAGAVDRPGTNAELHVVDERITGRRPATLSWTDAAAMPLTALTGWELLFDRLHVPRGTGSAGGTLLVIGGAGGVGSVLIQLARRLTGLTVVATASRPETARWCARMGAHHVVDHRRPLDEELGRIGVPQADHVAGLTATDRHLDAIARLIAPQGTLAVIDDPEVLDVTPLKQKAVTVAWELVFTRSLFHTADMARQGDILDEVAALLEEGVLVPTVTTTLGALTPQTLAEAHRRGGSGSSIGKTVLPGIGAGGS
jgi:zinc-binding alcohol dehydrogenase family protein